VAQTVGVVGIFVAGDNLIDALPQQGQRVVAYI
jgi:6-phosphogluconate dehydrogenase